MFKNIKNRISFIGIFITMLFLMIIYHAINGRIGPAIGHAILFAMLSCMYLFNIALEQRRDRNENLKDNSIKH